MTCIVLGDEFVFKVIYVSIKLCIYTYSNAILKSLHTLELKLKFTFFYIMIKVNSKWKELYIALSLTSDLQI